MTRGNQSVRDRADEPAGGRGMHGQTRASSSASADVATLRSVGVPLPARSLLRIARRLAADLVRRHRRAGVHAGLCPEAVLVGADGTVTLLDAHRPAAERAPYTAPEQSGRLARDVDERADLYALGVVLYELATGELPFGAGRSAERVRAQLSGAAPSPGTMPPGVAGLITTLLATLPEDRYQSAAGVVADLRRCADELAATGTVEAFPTGPADVPNRLTFPGRLYGRRGRLTQLMAARERVGRGGGAELVAVTADPGLGKTALLGTFADTVVLDGGWVARSAFGARDAAPYAAVGRLLTDLAEHLVMRCGGQLDAWRERLTAELGGTGPVLATLAPALAPLCGTGTVAVSGRRARALLRLGVRRLLSAVCAAEAPLVLVLDDLHRADPASVELLRYVLTDPETSGLLVVAALRPQGVPDPVAALLSESAGNSLSLRPLPDTALIELLTDTLRARRQPAVDLARVVADKTGSRPLAVAEFLRGLRNAKLLTFDEPAGVWRWDRVGVAAAKPVHDVLPAIQHRLAGLPARLVRMLQMAAVLGDRLHTDLLGTVTGAGPGSLLDLLHAAVREGLLAKAPGTGRFRWPHEVVRRAVLATMREAERAELTAAIGRLLLTEPNADPHLVVELCGGTPAGSVADRAQLASRALAAGRHAYQIGALDAARDRMRVAVNLLPPGGWARRGPLAYAVHLHAARTARAADDAGRADELLDLAAGYAADDLARAEVLALRARWRRADGQPAAAAAATRQALGLLGLDLPADPARWRTLAGAAAAALTRQLADVDVVEFARGLTASDPRAVLALEVIAEAVTVPAGPIVAAGPVAPVVAAGPAGPVGPVAPVVAAGPAQPARDRSDDDWSALLAATGVRLAFDFGPTPAAALAFAGHAAALARRGGRHDGPESSSAARAARVALALVDSYPAPGYPARVAPVVALVRALWYEPEAAPVTHLDQGYRTAIEDGEPVLALDNLVLSIAHRFVLGTPLGALADELDTLGRLAGRDGGGDRIAGPAGALGAALARLAGDAADLPTGTDLPPVERAVTVLTTCLLGEHAPARSMPPGDDDGGFLSAVTAFYHALALAAEYPDVDGPRQEQILAELAGRQAVLDEWAHHGPAAFDAYAALLAAERARLAGDADEAAARYTRAVDSARKQSLGAVEGLAAELGGRHALARAETAAAVAHLRRARDCYLRWRAPALVAHVDRMLAAVPTRPHRAFDQLDLFAIVRAFQAIAGELSVDRLVVTLLTLLVEHTHAERGALLLPDGAGLAVAATVRAERGGTSVVTDPRQLATERVPETVVEHVLRRRQALGGRPAELPARLAGDRYLHEQPPAALLCTPILRDGRLMAVLYLEHQHLSTWFSAEHFDLLDLLCAQAAIALDNARVHARLLEANQVLDATFDRLPVGLILLGPDLTVRRASPRAVEVTGLPIHPGTPLVDLFDVLTPTDADGLPYRLEPGFARVSEHSEPIHRDVLIILPGGQRQRVHTSAIPLRNDSDELIGVTLLVSPAGGGTGPGATVPGWLVSGQPPADPR
jgi:PAS domain-containing protein